MNLLCKLGFHKWSEDNFISSNNSAPVIVNKITRHCKKCEKIKIERWLSQKED